MNLANKLTVSRIIMIPFFVAVFYLTIIPYNFAISAGIFALASLTDFLDGYIARKKNMVTDFGKFLDPIADKILVSTALIVMLCTPEGANQILPWYASIAVAIILARELIISGFRLVAANKNIVIAADKTGKIKTFIQDVAILVLLVVASFCPMYSIANIIGLGLLAVATVLTIVSGISYMVKNKEVIATK